MKKIIINVIYILIGLGFLVLFNNFFSFVDGQNKEILKNEYINGIVDTVFYERSNHNARIFVVNEREYSCTTWYIADSIGMGDSVYKNKGEFNLKLMKKNGGSVFDCWYVNY